MTDSGVTIFWHRRDLRIADNRGLVTAATEGSVLPVYVVDPRLLATAGEARKAFFVASLASLQQAYRSLGTDLLVKTGTPESVLPEIAATRDATEVYWNEDYTGFAQDRDDAVEGALDSSIAVTRFADSTVYEPGSILTNAGDYYSVFSYYFKKWDKRENPAVEPDPDESAFIDHTASDVIEITSAPTDSVPLDPGRAAAVARLEEFIDGPIFEYATKRDDPAAAATSRLSQDLSFGLLGPREVLAAIESAEDEATTEEATESVTEFRRQIAWRDFYMQVLAAHPETVTENFKSYENPIEWRDAPANLEAWKAGETGYPIVDAGMRQLQAEAYMHNRLRMIVASFLTKDLQIDWRKGYRHFRTELVDHDTANDVGGWQWAASTGTDSQPYFRIFNPMTQGERHDPEAEYIKRYVPELRSVDPSKIHSWHELDSEQRVELAPEYPAPIVDHSERRESAIEMFERARGDEE